MTYDAVKHLCGLQPRTFEAMMSVLRQVESHKPPGRPSKLSMEDQLLMTIEYWREYRTYFHIRQSWGVNESTVYRIIRKIEDALVSSRAFTLPGKKKLQQSNCQLEVVVVDVTETPIERPKNNKNSSPVAKRFIHTLKSQVIVNQSTGEIICTAHGKGREHDFRIFKNSKVRLREEIKILGDKGYQGIQKLHPNSQTPKKKTRGNDLSISDKKRNRELARIRVVGENVH